MSDYPEDARTTAVKIKAAYNESITSVSSGIGEIPAMIDELHGEIMKNREMWGMLNDKLRAVTNQMESPMKDIPSTPMISELGSRLRDMRDYLAQTNSMLWELHQSIQL